MKKKIEQRSDDSPSVIDPSATGNNERQMFMHDIIGLIKLTRSSLGQWLVEERKILRRFLTLQNILQLRKQFEELRTLVLLK